MRIIARGTLRNFWQNSWYDEARQADWKSPQDIKQQYRNASFVANNRIVFNIHGNKYRLVIAVKYSLGICFIRFIGTHKQYNSIDVETI